MKHILTLIALITLNPLIAGEISRGPSLTTKYLSNQFRVRSWSLIYSIPNPKDAVAIRMFYKEKDASGKHTTVTYLVGFGSLPVKGEDKLPLLILVDSSRSTIILPNGSAVGKGVAFDSNAVTYSKRQKDKEDTEYILLRTFHDSSKSASPENIKSELLLEIIQAK